MGRRKMEMKLIENEKARNKVFEKRRNNLLKKAKELSILCDTKVLLIIYELDKQKPEIWPDNDEEAEQVINKFKRRPCDSFASRKKQSAEKFATSDQKSMMNHLSENDLQELCCDLDAKMAAVMNAIKSKQVLMQGHRSPKMLGGSEAIGFLKKTKEKEVVIYQEPVHTQQDQSFQMLYNNPNFMESPMMMMQNGFSYPEFDGSSSSSNIPYDPWPTHYFDPSWTQPAYMNSSSSTGYYDPTSYHIPLGGVYYTMIPGFPSQMNPYG